MFKIGITGGIGSGKTTIAKFLSELAEIPIIDADKIARALVRGSLLSHPQNPILKKIAQEFDGVISSDGTLNRTNLGTIIFNSKKQREKLNRIMFPIIQDAVLEKFNEYEQLGQEYVIYDAPLLFESAGHELVDYIVMVYVPQNIQIKRIQRRNDLTEQEALSRVNSQVSIDDLLKRESDFLIRNTIGLNGLSAITATLWADIREKHEGNNV